jgi:hypothetical protein
LRSLILPIFLFVLANIGCTSAQMSWEKILDSRITNLCEVELTNPEDRDAIIAHAYVDGLKAVLNEIKKNIETEGYDPILFELYAAIKLKEDPIDDDIFLLLSEYISNEKENAIPFYLMSYYYARKEDFRMSIEFLRKGNRVDECRLHMAEKKEILFNYYLLKTNDEFAAYSSQFSVINPNLNMVFRDLVRKLKSCSSFGISKDELIQFGRKYEKCGTALIDKVISIVMQMDCLDKDKDHELYSAINDRHKYYWSTLAQRAYDQNGEAELLHYMKNAFEHGEVYALEQLPPPNNGLDKEVR